MITTSLENISVQTSESFGIPVTVSHAQHLPLISADVAHQLLMIVREAVTNAATHAHSRAIELTARLENQKLVLGVSDDGIGFNPESVSARAGDHFGIIGMHERAEMIGADIAIKSSDGHGTFVEVSLPIGS